MNPATDVAWTKILDKLDSITFVARSNGDIVAATPTLGAWVSSNGGTTWTQVASPPHINCLVESAAHEVWCTHNFSANQIPGDGFGIMKTTDLASWTGVLRYQDITGPVMCSAGTQQADACVSDPQTDGGTGVWCSLMCQLGITSTAITCPSCTGSPDAGPTMSPPKKGCCDTGGGGVPATVVISIALGIALIRPRRR